MRKRIMRASSVGVLAVLSLMLPAAVGAHNAGHFILPDGSCHIVGSFKPAPLVGQDRVQLDLMPQTPNPPFDEYGTSYAAFQGQTPILPGGCPA
jgi:hypothetical protein